MRIFRKLRTYTWDIVILVVNLILWTHMDQILLRLDPTSAVPSGEFLAKFLFAAFGLGLAHVSAKIFMATGWRILDRSLEAHFAKHFNSLERWQQIRVSLLVFCLYFVAFVLLVLAM